MGRKVGEMSSGELISYIRNAEKKTPVRAYISLPASLSEGAAGGEKMKRDSALREGKHRVLDELNELFAGCKVFDCVNTIVVFGEYLKVREGVMKLEKILCGNVEKGSRKEELDGLAVEIEVLARNSAVPLLDISGINARIEPGAIIREKVSIGDNAVIMMGAIINIGARVGARTMIDMGAVLGGRAEVGADCHIGAGAVVAGVIEPESAVPTVIEDNVFVGANAVIIEGVRVGAGSVIGAGAVVTHDVAPGSLAVGIPARTVPIKSKELIAKTSNCPELREIENQDI